MKFTPKKESEISRFELLPDGDYPFTVLESKEQESKSAKNQGKIMAALKLAVHRPDGGDQWVFDYLADWFSEWKLKHICDACGKSAQYESGSVSFANNGAKGWMGYVRISSQERSGEYGPKNIVDDYIVTTGTAPNPQPALPRPASPPAQYNVADDVPF